MQDLVPIPDPTKLTTDAVSLAKEEIEKYFLLHVNGLRELIEERFRGVNIEFKMRDIALAAAFKAAESQVEQQNRSNTIAGDKASAAFTKQIESLDEKIEDLKQRIADLSSRNWAGIGGYLIGAVGVIAVVLAILEHLK